MKSYKVIVNTKLSQLNVSQKAYLEIFSKSLAQISANNHREIQTAKV